VDEVVELYQRNGFVHLPKVLSPEVTARCCAELERMTGETQLFKEQPDASPRQDLNGQIVFDRVEPVCSNSSVFEEVVAMLAPPASDVLGCAASLFKDKMIFKPPGTDGYLAHHDFAYWTHMGIPADELLTIMVTLDSADATNGALEVFPGMHRKEFRASRQDPLDIEVNALAGCDSQILECSPGDAIVFHSRLPHRSGPNVSTQNRRCWFTSWAPARWGNRYVDVYQERLQGYVPPRDHRAFTGVGS